MPVKDVEAAILNALRIQPVFQVTTHNTPLPYTFEIGAVQELSTYLATSAGRRLCFIVGAQTKPDETQILYKVLEYKSEAVNKFSLGALLNTPVDVTYVPISPQRIPKMTDKLNAQLQAGVSKLAFRASVQAARVRGERASEDCSFSSGSRCRRPDPPP